MFFRHAELSEIEKVFAALGLFCGRQIDHRYMVARITRDCTNLVSMNHEDLQSACASATPVWITLLGARNSGLTQAAGLDNGPPYVIRLQLLTVNPVPNGGFVCTAHPFTRRDFEDPFVLQELVTFRFDWDPAKSVGTFQYVQPPRS